MTVGLQQLADRMDSLVDEKAYQAVIRLHHAILSRIPDPSEPFWKVLENTEGLEPEAIRQRSDDIKAFSDQIGKISQYFWESKVRKHQLKLSLHQWCDLITAEVTMIHLKNSRKHVLESYIES